MIIRITEAADEPGYMYDIWMGYSEPEDVTDVDPDDGGHCTSTHMKNAIRMACDTALDLIGHKHPENI